MRGAAFFAKLRRSEYARSTATNTVGLLVSSAIPILSSPILSRLYLPSDFGQFGLYATIVALGGLSVTGRYEVAIVVPADEREAVELAVGAAAVTLVLSVLLLAFALLCRWLVPNLIPVDQGLLLLAPAAMTAVGWGQIALNFAIRQKAFRRMSIGRTTAAIAGACVSITLGLANPSSWGLAFGVLTNQTLLAIALGGPLVAAAMKLRGELGLGVLITRLQRYRGYPLYSLPSSFVDTFSTSLPVMIFSAYFGASATGYLVMFQRVWNASSILGKGLGETFRQKAASDRAKIGNFSRSYIATLIPLALIGSAIWLAMSVAAPTAFDTILGSKWHEAGVYAQILATGVCLQFIASPLSWSAYIAEKLKANAVWQISLLPVVAGSLWCGVTLHEPRMALIFLSIALGAMSAIYLYMSYRFSRTALVPAGRPEAPPTRN